MTISALTTDTSDINMESHFEQHAYNNSDEFWDEVRDMISEFDIAFDDELIHLKEQETEVAEPDRNASVHAVNANSVKVDARKRSPLKSSDDVEKTEEQSEDGQVSDECEIVNVSKISDKERKKRIVVTSSSSESSDSSPKRKHKQRKDRRRKDKKKTKKKHKYQSRSRSSSLEKMKEAIKKRLRESELLDEIERLEAEKRRRLKALSPESYEPFKIAMPDMNFKPIPKPSTSKDIKVTESGFILKPLTKLGSRSRSKSFEPFIDGPMELVIPKDYPEEPNRWRRCHKREDFSLKLKDRAFSPKRRSPTPRRRSPSPRRRSPSPRRRSSSLSRRRCISPLGKRRSPSPFLRRRSRDSSSRRSNRSPSPSSTSRAKSPKTRDKKARSRSASPRKVRNYRRREPSKESTLSSISEKSSVQSEKEKKSRREGKKSRWSTTAPTVPKVASDDENWDDIVDAAPKTDGAGYDLEEVKAAPKQLFSFLSVNKDIVKNKGGEGPKSKGARRRANKVKRTIRIDDDEADVIMVGTGPTVDKLAKSTDEDWDVLLKSSIEPPSSYDMKEVLKLNPKYKRKKLPLFGPNAFSLMLEPISSAALIADQTGPLVPSEEGELSSHSDGEQPLPPGVDPEEFGKAPSSPKIEAPLILIPLPPPPLPPIIPPPVLPVSEILLPPGVEENEQDTVVAIPPLVKKHSEVKRLREKFDLLPPGLDEDEFLPPPFNFLVPLKPPVAKKEDTSKLASGTIFFEDEPKEEVTPGGCDKEKVEDVICVESSAKDDTRQESESDSSDTQAAVETSSEPMEEEEAPPIPGETPEEVPIPDVDPSKLLPYTLIKEKQDEDLIYSRIKETIDKAEPPSADIRYLMEEYQPMRITSSGLLYREKDNQTLIIIPESLINETIASLHVIESDRHLNKEITTERLTERYFWPFMFDTIHDFIANCPECSGKL